MMSRRPLLPSPLAGEGGDAQGAAPGEGRERNRFLHKNMTDAERKLWCALRDRRFSNVKFRRQVSVGRFIVDFVSFERRVIVEADGSQHVESDYDVGRDRWLRSRGFTVLRFWNTDILNDLGGVLDAIAEVVRQRPSPGAAKPRRPLPQGEREKASYWMDEPGQDGVQNAASGEGRAAGKVKLP